MSEKTQTVVVLGASPKPERYSNQAVSTLSEYGYNVIPINPSGTAIHGFVATKRLEDIEIPVGTLTLYVNAEVSSRLCEAILQLEPGRVIFNPGQRIRNWRKHWRARG